jgi:endonuclease/exonuclease/phosphatase family metal-dependent hydrolase
VAVIDFSLSPIERSSKQKNQQRNLELNDTRNQMDLTDVYKIFHPMTVKYTFFSAAHKTLSKVDHILGHKASLSKYKKIKITPCILSDHNALRLELNDKRSRRKYTNN